jgi:GntR family transcriptional regulator
MLEFGMSRYAVRSALQRLESDGQINRQPGRGTVVVEATAPAPSWAIHTVEDLIDRNLQERPIVLSAQSVPVRAYPEIAELFALRPRDQIFMIERLSRSRDTGARFYSLNFLPVKVGLALPGQGTGREPLAVQIEKLRKTRAHRVRQDTWGSQASETVAHHLKITTGAPTVVVRRTYYGWDGEVIVLGDLHYRLEDFRQVIDLFRENTPKP